MSKDTNYANAMAIYQMYGAESDLKSFCQQNKINYARFYQYLKEHGGLSETAAPQEPSEPRLCPVEITGMPVQSDSPILEKAEICFGQGLALSRENIRLADLVSLITKVSKALC